MTRKGGRRGLAGKRTGVADVSPVEGGRTGAIQGRAWRTRAGAADKDGGGGKRGSIFGRTRTGAADEEERGRRGRRWRQTRQCLRADEDGRGGRGSRANRIVVAKLKKYEKIEAIFNQIVKLIHFLVQLSSTS